MNKSLTLRIRAMQSQKMTVNEIADKLMIKPTDVEAHLISNGYTPLYERAKPEPHEWQTKPKTSTDNIKKTPLTAEERAEILQLHKDGFGVCKIAVKLGRSQSTITRTIQKATQTPSTKGVSKSTKKSFERNAKINPIVDETQVKFKEEVEPMKTTEKEPAPTAIGTSSNQNILNTSVPLKTENVKPKSTLDFVIKQLKLANDTMQCIYDSDLRNIETQTIMDLGELWARITIAKEMLEEVAEC